jgi:hemerythrin
MEKISIDPIHFQSIHIHQKDKESENIKIPLPIHSDNSEKESSKSGNTTSPRGIFIILDRESILADVHIEDIVKFECQNKDIAKEHNILYQLLDKLGEFYKTYINNDKLDESILRELISNLYKDTVNHFMIEESLLITNNESSTHILEHKKFLKWFGQELRSLNINADRDDKDGGNSPRYKALRLKHFIIHFIIWFNHHTKYFDNNIPGNCCC